MTIEALNAMKGDDSRPKGAGLVWPASPSEVRQVQPVPLTDGGVYDQYADPAPVAPVQQPPAPRPEPEPQHTPVPEADPEPQRPATSLEKRDPAPAPAPVAEPETPAAEPQPDKPTGPTAAEITEARRAEAALKAAEQLRRKARALTWTAWFWTAVVIAISAVITAFGSGNAHTVFLRHNTTDPWAWFPYPALEAALIVEIQIGGVLAQHKQSVKFWGTALRIVTAIAAVTLCVYGPAEEGDGGGAVLHAIGPFTQFWLAEFLAAARTRFQAAIESLLDRADGRERAATEPGQSSAQDRSSRSRARQRKTSGAVPRKTAENAPEGGSEDRSSDSGTGPELVLTPHEKRALKAIRAKGLYPSKATVQKEVRAAGGGIGTKRALALSAAWRTGGTGPDLHVVNEKEAQ